MPAGSVYAAPVGTKLGDEGWKLIGYTSEDGLTMTEPFRPSYPSIRAWNDSSEWIAKGWKPAGFANETPAWLRLRDRINTACDYSMPSRWMLGVDQLSINERSKPMGLTKNHEYTDNDGDSIVINKPKNDPEGTVAHVVTPSEDGEGFYVTAADSIPLALNVLGYDRPSDAPYQAGPTFYAGREANEPIPSSQGARDQNVATAIDLLRGVDIYDQRVAERKVKAAEWEKKAAAEAKGPRGCRP